MRNWSLPWVVQVVLPALNQEDLEVVVQVRQSSSDDASELWLAAAFLGHGENLPARPSTADNDINLKLD